MGVNAAVDEQAVESLANVFAEVKAHLDERQRRLLLGAMARELGRGGQAALSAVTGEAKDVIGRGSASLEAGVEPDGRVREPGGGRKPVTELDPELAGALEELVDPESRGDPMKPLRWTTKSTQNLADELTRQEHRCGPRTVAGLLKQRGYTLHGNNKTVEGKQHPDRGKQFRYINDLAAAALASRWPVISVDTMKKEPAPRSALSYP